MGLIFGSFLTRLLGLAKGVPAWAWLLAVVLGWGGLQRCSAIEAKATFAKAKAQAAAEQSAQRERDVAETQRRTKTVMEAADAATIQSTADRAAAGDARAALERVRRELAADQAKRRAADAAASPGSAPAIAADSVPAELLSRCGERVLELAAYADDARRAGRACERAYDAVSEAPM